MEWNKDVMKSANNEDVDTDFNGNSLYKNYSDSFIGSKETFFFN